MKNLRISGSRGAFYAFSINDDFPVSIDILYPRTVRPCLFEENPIFVRYSWFFLPVL